MYKRQAAAVVVLLSDLPEQAAIDITIAPVKNKATIFFIFFIVSLLFFLLYKSWTYCYIFIIPITASC